MFAFLKEKPKLMTILSLLIGLSIFILVSAISNSYLKSFNAANRISERYYNSIKCLDEINFHLSNVEGNERGFILSGNKKFIMNIEAEDSIINFNINRIDRLLIDEDDIATFSEQKRVIRKKQAYVFNIILIYKNQGMNSASNQFKTLQGFELMNTVVDLGNQLQNSLRQKIADQYNKALIFESQIKIWNIFAIIVVILIISLSIRSIFNELDKRETMNAELKVARDKANAAKAFKQQFLSDMSHEVRTPVHTISGFADLLLQLPMEADQRVYISAIQQSSKNLLTIVNDVLDYSKIDAGMLNIAKENFSISAVIHNVTISFSEKIQAAKNTFNVQLDQKLPVVVIGDSVRLSQILFNLVGNATKFTQNGQITLVVDQTILEANKALINFSVFDSGIGISSRKLQTIFGRFEQAESSTSKLYGGTGLGLSIVKQLVELQGGRISVYSIPNVGSEFSFQIPYEIPNLEQDVIVENFNKPKLNHTYNAKILLAEDNILNQKLAETILTEMGFTVVIADDGEQATSLFRQQAFDLLLLDIQMPKLNGYEVSAYIRQELKSNIPIIAVTSGSLIDEHEKAKAVGINVCISKPIDKKILSEKLNELMFAKTDVFVEAPLDMSEQGNKIVDLKYLYDVSNTNHNFVLEMIATFIEHSQHDLVLLEKAIQLRNSDDVKYLSHKMRSSLQYMGVRKEIENLLLKIENFETSKTEFDTIADVFGLFKKEMVSVYAFLTQIDLAYLQSK